MTHEQTSALQPLFDKHTPGPWHWTRTSAIELKDGNEPVYLQSLATNWEHGIGQREILTEMRLSKARKLEDEANATLIAAAPETAAERDALKIQRDELLEALEQCENLLSELQDGGAENPELEIARVAIAKARGQL